MTNVESNSSSRVTRSARQRLGQRNPGPSRREWAPALSRVALVTDIAVIVGVLGVAQFVRFGSDRAVLTQQLHVELSYTAVSAAIATLWLLMLGIHGSRAPHVIGGGPEEYRLIVTATLQLFGSLAIVSVLLRIDFARGYLVIAFPVGLFALLFARWLLRQRVARMRLRGEAQTSVLVVGREKAVVDLARSLERHKASGHQVVGVCVPGHSGERGDHLEVDGRRIPVFGNEETVIQALVFSGADKVAVTATEELGYDGIRKLMWDLDPYDVDLVVSPGVADVSGPRLLMTPVAGLPLIRVQRPTYRGAKRVGKSVFDVSVALGALIVFSPIMLITALAIKLTSRGPVFYIAERIGIEGRPFGMIKFRSMVVGADQMRDELDGNDGAGPLFKLREDPRVTPVGRFLRRFSLDELPQFFNVLKRDMSVVGPRPPLRNEVESYDGEVRRRLLVRPGVTGLWQISGRSDLSWEESVRLDLSYVENWSMIEDALIVVKTVRVVAAGDGAY